MIYFQDVCHIWELGGGTMYTNLLETPLNPNGREFYSFSKLKVGVTDNNSNEMEWVRQIRLRYSYTTILIMTFPFVFFW